MFFPSQSMAEMLMEFHITLQQIFQIVLTILTALGTTLGVTSCMGV